MKALLFEDSIPVPRLLCLAATISILLGNYQLFVYFRPTTEALGQAVVIGTFCLVGLVHVAVLGYARRVARDFCCKVAFVNTTVAIMTFTALHPGIRGYFGLPLTLAVSLLYAFMAAVFVFLGVLLGIHLMQGRWECLESAEEFDGRIMDEDMEP